MTPDQISPESVPPSNKIEDKSGNATYFEMSTLQCTDSAKLFKLARKNRLTHSQLISRYNYRRKPLPYFLRLPIYTGSRALFPSLTRFLLARARARALHIPRPVARRFLRSFFFLSFSFYADRLYNIVTLFLALSIYIMRCRGARGARSLDRSLRHSTCTYRIGESYFEAEPQCLECKVS